MCLSDGKPAGDLGAQIPLDQRPTRSSQTISPLVILPVAESFTKSTMDQNHVDQAYAEELFLWIYKGPDEEQRKQKLQELANAFDKDAKTVLDAVHSVATKENLYPQEPSFLVPEDAAPTWTNCIGEQPCVPLQYKYPASLSDLVNIVHDAASRNPKVPVRAIGSGHSFSDITDSQGAILVDPSRNLKQVLTVDPSILHPGADAPNTIRAQCGIKVAALNPRARRSQPRPHQHGRLRRTDHLRRSVHRHARLWQELWAHGRFSPVHRACDGERQGLSDRTLPRLGHHQPPQSFLVIYPRHPTSPSS